MRLLAVAVVVLATLAISRDASATCGPGRAISFTLEVKHRVPRAGQGPVVRTQDDTVEVVDAAGKLLWKKKLPAGYGPATVLGDRIAFGVETATTIGVAMFSLKSGAPMRGVSRPIGKQRVWGVVGVTSVDAGHLRISAFAEVCVTL
jgi:hypothetical protein